MAAKKNKTGKSFPGQVRIIAGEWRGRKLDVIDSPGFRPTPDRVKETVFNWLQPWLPGARCLDLFAGSGALCLEALSRGAAEAVMIEKDSTVAANLRRNVDKLKAESARPVNTDALSYLEGAPEKFDIVFVDPPFAEPGLIDQCLERLDAGGWFNSGALVYIEASADRSPIECPPGWTDLKHKKTGQVGYYLFQSPDNNPDKG